MEGKKTSTKGGGKKRSDNSIVGGSWERSFAESKETLKQRDRL